MCKEDAKRGQQIAESIRRVLLNLDLRLVYADTQHKVAYEDFKLHSKLGGTKNTRKAMRAKAQSEVYRIFIENVNRIKSEVTISLDAVLSRYTPKYKRIWVMYFLEQASIDEIAEDVHYSRESINKIVKKLKLDLNSHYKEGTNDANY